MDQMGKSPGRIGVEVLIAVVILVVVVAVVWWAKFEESTPELPEPPAFEVTESMVPKGPPKVKPPTTPPPVN